MKHKSVLLNETIEGLSLADKDTGQIVLDATFGGGGHSRAVLERYPSAKVIALDQDGSVWKESEWKRFAGRITFHRENFRNLDKVLGERKVDGIIFDLGISSDQLEASRAGTARGFSFKENEPLLMTLKDNPGPEDLNARTIVNEWSRENLEKIIRGYGEERFAKRIARGIEEARRNAEIQTTHDLVKVIEAAVPLGYKHGRIHFATRTFQALRIAVNDELGALTEGLRKGLDALKESKDGSRGGRMSVISFHSLEDRIVKNFNKETAEKGKARIINKKPIVSGEDELRDNPRARSAKLRILEKI